MANKYILMPEPNYRAIIQKNNIPNQKGEGDDLNEMFELNFAKKKLNQLKQKRKGRKIKNVSAKNIMYKQRLRSYLRARKSLKDKPIGVTLGTEGPKVIAKGIQQAILSDQGEALPLTKAEYTAPAKPEAAFEVAGTPIKSPVKTPLKTPPKSILPPKTTPVSRRQQTQQYKQESKERAVLQKIDQLKEIILSSPERFSVNKDLELINPSTQKPIEKSNIDKILYRLVNPSILNAPSPPGTRSLRKLLTEDPEGNKILYQSGRGWRGKKPKKMKFKPTNWRLLKRKK